MPVSTTTKRKRGWRAQIPQKISSATSSLTPSGASAMNDSRTPGVGSKSRWRCIPRGPWMWKESGTSAAATSVQSGSHTGSL